MTKKHCTDIIFAGAGHNRMITKQQGCHVIAQKDKQMNEKIVHSRFHESLFQQRKLKRKIKAYQARLYLFNTSSNNACDFRVRKSKPVSAVN